MHDHLGLLYNPHHIRYSNPMHNPHMLSPVHPMHPGLHTAHYVQLLHDGQHASVLHSYADELVLFLSYWNYLCYFHYLLPVLQQQTLMGQALLFPVFYQKQMYLMSHSSQNHSLHVTPAQKVLSLYHSSSYLPSLTLLSWNRSYQTLPAQKNLLFSFPLPFHHWKHSSYLLLLLLYCHHQ